MKINLKTGKWGLNRLLHLAILQSFLVALATASVLPRPNIKQRSTTQTANLDKDYSEGTIVIVTSSELPKQIPPPPTPTKPHRPTPRYDVTPSAKELQRKFGLHDKDIFSSLRIPYALNGNSFLNLS